MEIYTCVSGELIQSIKVHSFLNNWYEKSTNKILSRLNIVDLNFDDEMLSIYISLMACIGQAMGVKTFWRSFQTLIHRFHAKVLFETFISHSGFFRWLMKGIFCTYVLWPFYKKLISQLVLRVRTHDYTISVSSTRSPLNKKATS